MGSCCVISRRIDNRGIRVVTEKYSRDQFAQRYDRKLKVPSAAL